MVSPALRVPVKTAAVVEVRPKTRITIVPGATATEKVLAPEKAFPIRIAPAGRVTVAVATAVKTGGVAKGGAEM
jgi:hypothetical protein